MEQYGTIWNNMEQYGTWSSFQFRASEISGVQLGTASPHFAGFKKTKTKVIKILYKLYKIKHAQTLKLAPFFWHP